MSYFKKYFSFALPLLICITHLSIAQDIRINEVLPANFNNLSDEDGDFEDWFELINIHTEVIQLENYRISDDNKFDSAWVFPKYLIKPNEFALLFASGKNMKEDQTFWQTTVKQGDEWKYIIPNESLTDWQKPNFDDSAWNTGASGFGYSDGDDATIISATPSIFLRDTFQLENIDNIKSAILHMDYDDGFIAYLNGIEIARANMGSVGQSFNYNAFSTADHEAKMYNGGLPEEFVINNFDQILIEGENLLAIEVHNVGENSSDLTAIPFFSVERELEPENYFTADFLKNKKNLHTNFKLDADGDSLFLFSPEGILIDQLIIENSKVDISHGYKVDDFSKLYAFENPTPGTSNTTLPFEFTDSLNIDFSVTGGIYNASVSVSLSTDNTTDTIYYSTDGSEPTSESSIYSSPLSFEQPTTLRARILRTGFLPGKTITNSYYPNYDKNLPITFVSTNPENLWDFDNGIYVLGGDAETNNPHFGANFWEDWEKPAHVELYMNDNNQSFSIDGGIKIFGGWSRAHDQRSISLFARKVYGDKSIKCKLFENRPYSKFESLVFRNSGNDWFSGTNNSGTMFRDLFMTSLGSQMQLETQAGKPTALYLNGDYWGIHNLREKVSKHYIASKKNEDSEKIDLLERNSQVIDGSNIHYQEMIDFVQYNNINNDENYEYIKSLMDVDNFIRYYVAQIYYFNDDWPHNNIKFWRPQRPNGRWRWILYDTDFGFGLWNKNKVYNNTIQLMTNTNEAEKMKPLWSTVLFRTLLSNNTFKNQFINTFADHINTTFNTEKVNEKIDYQANLIYNEISKHTARWGGNLSVWNTNKTLLKEFGRIRPNVVRNHLEDFFGLNDQQKVRLKISGVQTATIKINTVRIDNFPWNGIYFNNIPIQLTAVPPTGYRFKNWQGDVNSTEASIHVEMKSDKDLTAVFEAYSPDENEGIIINEISYHASPDADTEDWVEIYNNSDQYVDISDWIIKDSNEEHEYKFTANTLMAPHAYIVVARNLEAFPLVFPTVKNVEGQLGFGFSSSGECIRLFNKNGELKDEVCYANEYPWPTGADGEGHTLSLSSPDADNSLAANWVNSINMNGSPAANNQWITAVSMKTKESETKLLNCYPNPFTNQISIPVISTGEHLKIDIINLNGQTVASLFNSYLSEGTHKLSWDGTGIRQGILLIRLQTNDGIQMQKVLKTSN